ncbi:MAG: acyltransferase [Chthoniobacteraceae bacterium]
MSASAAASGHLSGFDLARGFAAVAIALFHFTNNGWLPAGHWLMEAGYFGHLGVRTFFVISGFVVPLAMWRGGFTGAAFGPFIARRMVRLYPPYLASVAIPAGAVGAGGVAIAPGPLAAHFAYLNDLLGVPWLIEIYWALAIEVQFYLVIALLWRWAASERAWPFVAMAAVVIASCFLPWPTRSLPRFGLCFLLGIAAFRWHASLGVRPVNAMIALLCALLMWSNDSAPAALAAVFPLALLALPLGVPRWAKGLSDISYSLYLFHLAAGAGFLGMFGAMPLSSGARVALVGVALALSIVTAWVAYRLVELPAGAWAKRFSYRRAALTPPAVSADSCAP